MSTLRHKLDAAVQESEQLLDTVHVRESNTSLGMPTMSLVHLQYKYEELVSNHASLLKILELKSNEVKKLEEENAILQEKIQNLKMDLENNIEKITMLKKEFSEINRRKKEKIKSFKIERRILGVVHNRLIALLHKQCIEKNDIINYYLKTTQDGQLGLLFQEIRKNNILNYENFCLQQELDYLRAFFRSYRTKSRHSIIN